MKHIYSKSSWESKLDFDIMDSIRTLNDFKVIDKKREPIPGKLLSQLIHKCTVTLISTFFDEAAYDLPALFFVAKILFYFIF